MPRSYSWERPISGPDSDSTFAGWGASAIVLLSVILGCVAFAGIMAGLGKLELLLGIAKPIEIKTQQVNLQQIEVAADPLPEIEEETLLAEEVDGSELLKEVEELIPELDNTELDISPEFEQPEVALAANMPLESGEDFAELMEPVAAPEISDVADQIGKMDNLFEEAAVGQVVIEEGSVKADIIDPDELLKDVASQGFGGLSEEGLPKGYASLDGLLRMETKELSRSRAALPSDLLFDYDSADLKETARFGLMKLAMLIDRNPEMFCVLEGHTDLFGDEVYNQGLSERRAQAVKNWLVDAMKLDGRQIVVRGFGLTRPKVNEGSIEEQAINRRVDILMRKEVPPIEPAGKAVVIEESPAPPQEPLKALPVPENPPVLEEKEPLQALPVE